MRHPVPESSSPRSASARWHVSYALALVGVAAVMMIAGIYSGALVWALVVAATPGLIGWLARATDGVGAKVALLVVWSLCAAAAATLAGGVSGPLGALTLTPLAAALVLDGRRLLAEGGALAVAAASLAGLTQAAGIAPLPPEEPARLWLSVAALAVLAAWGAAALSVARRSGDPVGADRRVDAALVAALARVEAAERARDSALESSRAKSRFLAEMSHELRTPLNAVLGFSDTMRMRMFGPISDRYGEYAELIHESGRHLLDLINDVLDMSKIEADRYELDRETFDVAEAAEAALRLVRGQASSAGVSLRQSLPARGLEVDADRRALKQMILNLVANALKFTPRGGSAVLSVAAVDGELEIVVADTGVGIAPEDVSRLGDPFEQAGGADQRAQGTGLGLALVRALAGLHGGTVALESRLGEGTAVTVRLPVLTSAEVTTLPTASAAAGGDEGLGRGEIADLEPGGADTAAGVGELHGHRLAGV